MRTRWRPRSPSLLTPAVLPDDATSVGLSGVGQARYHEIRAALEDITTRLFADFPSEDLATAGRVLAIVTARANAELADPELSWP